MNNLAYQNLTVLAPRSLDSLLPLEIIDDLSPIRAAFVERYGIHHLPTAWQESCGFYILFSHISPDNTFEAYVGKATNGFYDRLKAHDKDKTFWRTALLVYKDRAPGFSSTQSSYMEGLMREILESSKNVTIHNIASTGDRTLPEWEHASMEAVALSTLRIMFLRGYRNASMARIAEDLVEKVEQIENPHPPTLKVPARPMRPAIMETPPPRVSFDPLVSPRRAAKAALLTPAVPVETATTPSAPETDSEDAVDPQEKERFQKLRAWRLTVARSKGWAPYMIFKDTALWAVAKANPQEMNDLFTIAGVSKYKAETYGIEMLSTLSASEPVQAE